MTSPRSASVREQRLHVRGDGRAARRPCGPPAPSTISATVRRASHSRRMAAALALQHQPALGIQQDGLARQAVVAQPGLGAPGPAARAAGSPAALPRRAAIVTQSSRCQSTSVLRTSAARQASCSSRVVAWATTKATASCESWRARVTRAAEVVQALAGHPGVVLLPGLDPPGHQVGGEELGQRRGHRHHQRAAAGPARRSRRRRSARRAAPRRQAATSPGSSPTAPASRSQWASPPGLPALALGDAVVVLDAADPHAPEGRVLRLRRG